MRIPFVLLCHTLDISSRRPGTVFGLGNKVWHERRSGFACESHHNGVW